MTDHNLIRFGVSIGETLLDRFDGLIDEKGYTNRSEAIRDLIRNTIIEFEHDSATATATAIGTISIVYDHHTREIGDRLTDLAHDHHDLVISSMHVHLTHASCLEVMVVKGPGETVRAFANAVISTRGVKHGKLVITGLVEDTME